MNNDREAAQSSGVPRPAQEDDQVSNSFGTLEQLNIPEISLPTGGGAIRGIDSQFQVNAANGTANISVPLPISPGRNGFQPSLTLGYNSGIGNSPFGLGWSLNLGSIQLKTDKKLPQYSGNPEDTYTYAGQEDLVPAYSLVDNNWVKDEFESGNLSIERYRPRIEGSFSRIERITNPDKGVYWKVTTKGNLVTFLGLTPEARLFDPEDETRIFKWLPELTYDDKGNWISHTYKREDSEGIPDVINERNRLNGTAKFTNLYLKSVQYGNQLPYYNSSPFDPDEITDQTHFFDLILDYGEHVADNPGFDDSGQWTYRPDAFSSYRSGFEIRTNRLCQRVLMFHTFAELGEAPSLVKSLDFQYQSSLEDETPFETTYLSAITLTGYEKKEDGSFRSKSFPPIEYEYQPLTWNNELVDIGEEEAKNTPSGLTNNYRWVDLFSEGISGILSESENTWYYKSNLGDSQFSELTEITQKPSFSGFNQGLVSIQDIESNGTKQLVVNSKEVKGFFTMDETSDWGEFRAFNKNLNIDPADPNLRQIDLNGNGKPDLLITENEVFTWYKSLGIEGFEEAQHIYKTLDEEQGPALVFKDHEQRIYLADMSGDGLTDIVRIKNGETCYWANKGHGKFSAKVSMANAPWFDHPDQFNPEYLHLSDVSGSGTTDLLYITDRYFKVYLNLSGNAFSDATQMDCHLPIDQHSKISVIDFLGNGTSAILWSSDHPDHASTPMRYIDLLSGQKPHLMSSSKNNLGMETHVNYKSSTYYYLQDKQAGNPWITKLPFPVHVIHSVTIKDLVSNAELSTSYRYHHGYYDSTEREFRGFGMVEQTDAESFETYLAESDLDQAPILTKSWFHTGAFVQKDVISNQYQDEYFADDSSDYQFPDSFIENVSALNAEESFQAYRALKGSLLRQEIYSLDGSELEPTPYTLVNSNFTVTRVQPASENASGCFMVSPRESITFAYERNTSDPRVSHSIILETDEYGHVQKSADIAYPRQSTVVEAHSEQRVLHASVKTSGFSHITDLGYQLGIPLTTRLYEIGGLGLDTDTYFSRDDLSAQLDGVLEPEVTLLHHESFSAGVQARLLGLTEHYYWNDDDPLVLGEISLPLRQHHSEQIVMSDEHRISVFEDRLTAAQMNAAGYELREDHWWLSGNTAHYKDENEFYLLDQTVDPFENSSRVYFDEYNFLPIQSEDALGNSIMAVPDYRTLGLKKLVDINDNSSEAITDPLGNVIATSVYGEVEGVLKGDDEISNYETLDDADLSDVIANSGDYLQGATSFFYYDLESWQRDQQPPVFVQLARETHVSELNDEEVAIQLTLGYSDGFGRELQSKVKISDSEWLVSGRKVYNNKEKPVKQYEPFITSDYGYQSEVDLQAFGVTPMLFYDPMDRLVRTETPEGFHSKVEFDPWQSVAYDQNDTVKESQNYLENASLIGTDDPKGIALEKASQHANTPLTVILDSLGREFLTQNLMGEGEESLVNYSEFDAQGNLLASTDPRQYQLNQSRSTEELITNFSYTYDLIGNVLRTKSIDNGVTYSLSNALGSPSHRWNARGFHIHNSYDAVHRPTLVVVSGNDLNHIVRKMEYGTDTSKNQNGRVIRSYDQAGKTETLLFDFKGQSLLSTLQLLSDYRSEANWSDTNALMLEPETFTYKMDYDAVGRIISSIQPDGSVHSTQYHPVGWLKSVSVQLREITFGTTSQALPTTLVNNIEYNAKGQRTKIEYGNGVHTSYSYDERTFELVRLVTMRNEEGGGQRVLQDLSYGYDPVGNIVSIIDNGHNLIFTAGQVVSPKMEFVYDALYQLKEASGREHLALSKTDYQKDSNSFKDSHFAHLNDANQLRNYTRKYTYDDSGNLNQMQHIGANPFTRNLTISDISNKAITDEMDTSLDVEQYFDEAGNIKELEHLESIQWNYRNNIASVTIIERESGNDAEYYVYNGGGQRVRKVKEAYNSSGDLLWMEDRIYLGGIELKRKYQGNNRTLREARSTLHVMDDVRRISMIHYWDQSNDPELLAGQNRIHYQLNNHLGSASLELDDNGQLISYEEYYPFGETAFTTGSSASEVKNKEYRYTGKERDDTTGLYYYGARYYAPWMGRWLNPDPAGTVDGLNLYQYVNNNPLKYEDRNGLKLTLSFDENYRGLVAQEDANQFAQEFIADAKATFGFDLSYNSETGELSIVKENLEEQKTALLERISTNCEGDSQCLSESTELVNEFIELLDSDSEVHMQIALSMISSAPLIDESGFDYSPVNAGAAGRFLARSDENLERYITTGFTTIKQADYGNNIYIVLNPLAFSNRTFRSKDGTDSGLPEGVANWGGPSLTVLHEFTHFKHKLKDPEVPGAGEPGDVVTRINQLRKGLGYPTRDRYFVGSDRTLEYSTGYVGRDPMAGVFRQRMTALQTILRVQEQNQTPVFDYDLFED